MTRRFYEGTLGLPVLFEDTQFLTFGCGGDSRLVVTKSSTGTGEAVTKASWRVEDLAGEVAELRKRGVTVQDLPELGAVDGVADLGFALAAWFVDPDHIWIGLRCWAPGSATCSLPRRCPSGSPCSPPASGSPWSSAPRSPPTPPPPRASRITIREALTYL
jgi:hypothetical protein